MILNKKPSIQTRTHKDTNNIEIIFNESFLDLNNVSLVISVEELLTQIENQLEINENNNSSSDDETTYSETDQEKLKKRLKKKLGKNVLDLEIQLRTFLKETESKFNPDDFRSYMQESKLKTPATIKSKISSFNYTNNYFFNDEHNINVNQKRNSLFENKLPSFFENIDKNNKFSSNQDFKKKPSKNEKNNQLSKFNLPNNQEDREYELNVSSNLVKENENDVADGTDITTDMIKQINLLESAESDKLILDLKHSFSIEKRGSIFDEKKSELNYINEDISEAESKSEASSVCSPRKESKHGSPSKHYK
jgi:hypothetical protein